MAQLQQRGIPTLTVLAFYQLAAPGMTAVLYRPLPGETLRQISNKERLKLRPKTVDSWPDFVASKHRLAITIAPP